MTNKSKRITTIIVTGALSWLMTPKAYELVMAHFNEIISLNTSQTVFVLITGFIVGTLLGAILNENFPEAMDKDNG